MTKLIVLDKTVESMTTFKQIIGRGTRIREKEGKTHFVVMDFRNVTRLFSDPDWDGPVEQVEGFQHGSGGNKPKGSEPGGIGEEPPVDPVETPIVDKDGCSVKIINKTVSVYDANGKLLRQEDIIDYTRTNIKGEYASLSDFIHKWKASDKKKTIEQSFIAMGIDLKALKAEQGMSDVDDFDFICYVAYGRKPLTRKERANNVKKKDFFSKYSVEAQAVLSILLDKYMNQGITEVEDIKVLSLADFADFGKPAKIVKLFGGKAQYEAAIKELEANIYELEVSYGEGDLETEAVGQGGYGFERVANADVIALAVGHALADEVAAVGGRVDDKVGRLAGETALDERLEGREIVVLTVKGQVVEEYNKAERRAERLLEQFGEAGDMARVIFRWLSVWLSVSRSWCFC